MSGAHLLARLEHAQSLLAAGQPDRARAELLRLLHANPANPALHTLLSQAFLLLGQDAQALHYARRAASLAPDHAGLLAALGRLLLITGHANEAVDAYARAVTLDPTLDVARRGLAGALIAAHRYTDAIAACRDGLARNAQLSPDTGLTMTLAGALHHLGHSTEALDLARESAARHPADAPFAGAVALLSNYVPRLDPVAVLAAHRAYGALLRETVPAPPRTYPQSRDQGRRLRIALISPDLRSHSVASFIEPFLIHHDRAAIDLCVYQTNHIADAVTARLRPRADHWRVVSTLPDAALADAIHADRVDIAVELSGLTEGHSLPAMHSRPAPVGVSYLGYPNTTGLDAIDYRLVDDVTDPAPDADALAVERLFRIDAPFLCYLPPADAPDVAPPPSLARGPHPAGITFGSFNALSKISDDLIALWARVLTAVPGSRLLLKAMSLADPALRLELPRRFAAQGLDDPARIELAPPTATVAAHLALYARVDVALDTHPYNGTTTTCEALLMGVPVVTLAGRVHAARVGASLLTAVGRPDLIADSEAAYIALAAALAADPASLAARRAAQRAEFLASPLCDAPAHTRRLEAAFRSMWRDLCTRPS